MKKLFTLLIAVISAFSLSAQRNEFVITGKVVDQATQQPLAGASVFCQNTTVGTVSKNEGEFSLHLPNGGYDLVVSYTGYETYSIRINNDNAAAPITIELKKQEKTMQEVAVVGSTEVVDGWARHGQFFLENFIGTTANAALCNLENPEALRFFYSKKRNRLKVLTKADIIIMNKALGYKIKYQLDSFTHEYANGISTFSGYPLFEEMQGTDEEKSIWKTNREKAYYGSRMHFMRSWYDSTLLDEGYTIQKVEDIKALDGVEIENPFDTTFYHADTSDVEIDIKGRLKVIYRNETPDARYLSYYKLPSYMKVQISAIDLADGFIIEENGYFYEQSDVINTGYWAWEKFAEALPYDYWPE